MGAAAVKSLQFLQIVQHRAARVAITASATRGQGAGVVVSAREFFGRLKLERFGIRDERVFARQLNATTRQLLERLPRHARNWGLARKLVNIFLRDCLYTSYLSKAHRLAMAEKLLEIPLDSITAKRIHEAVPLLPRWPGVKHLDRATSDAYQAAALAVARQHGVARAHLDAYWWGARE